MSLNTQNAILSNAITVDSSYNVGIGTSTPSFATGMGLEIYGGSVQPRISLKNNSTTDGNTRGFQLAVSAPDAIIENREVGDMRFFTTTVAGSSTERMRITSGGNVGIGTSSPSQVLDIVRAGGAYVSVTSGSVDFLSGIDSSGMPRLYTSGSNPISFWTNATERMRITSGGDLLVGSTSASTSSNGVWIYKTSNGSGRINIIKIVSGTNSAIANYFNGTYVGGMDYGDTITTFVTTSDYRLKQDFKDFSGLNLISSIKTYDYEWKSDKTRAFGVIAHELQDVIPYAVRGEKDGEEMQGVDYSKLVPILVKAIQELSDKVTALESK